jgi:hypothetical protein
VLTNDLQLSDNEEDEEEEEEEDMDVSEEEEEEDVAERYRDAERDQSKATGSNDMPEQPPPAGTMFFVDNDGQAVSMVPSGADAQFVQG